MAESYKSKVEIIMKETFLEKQMMIGSSNGFLTKQFDLKTLIKKASKNKEEEENKDESNEYKIELVMFCYYFIETLFELTCNIIYELLDYESLAFISYIISDHFIFIVSQNILSFCRDDFSKVI